MRRLLALGFAALAAACATDGAPGPVPAGSSATTPSRFAAGRSYYSDEAELVGEVHRLGAEKNLEEVYQYYSYYEAIHDEQQRVVTFKRYLRGDLDWTERYTYDGSGRLVRRERIRPGQPSEVSDFAP